MMQLIALLSMLIARIDVGGQTGRSGSRRVAGPPFRQGPLLQRFTKRGT